MSLFTSDRERRCWIWTLIVLAAIYSTLGLARELVEGLRERNLLQVSAAVVLVLIAAVIAVRWVRKRPGLREIAVGFGVAAVYFMALIRVQYPEERTHLIEYGVVALLIHRALVERRRSGNRIPAPAVLAVVLTALLGWIDEGIQAVLPNRFYDIRDVGFNALAGLMAISASLALAWARRSIGLKNRSENP